MFHLVMGLQIKFIHFGSVDQFLENRDVLLRVEFIFGWVFTRRYKAYSLINSLHLFYSLDTIVDSLPNFLNSLVLLLCFFSNGVVNLDERFLEFVQVY